MSSYLEYHEIKHELSAAKSEQQNGVAERRNQTLKEAARTMLAESGISQRFCSEAVNTIIWFLRQRPSLSTYHSTRVSCCGSCGFDLNLNSSSRNASTIGSKYGKSMKKGIISFFSIDDSRFNQVEEFSFNKFPTLNTPPFISKHSWGLFWKRTKLSCRKCGNYIGIANDFNAFSPRLITNGSDSPSSNEISNLRKYNIRIGSLQPSLADIGTPFVS
ncbi:uncharacterized protein At4g08330, chloroplastic-like [Primulina eburnea]|uniref:uncharacterized protein At4g08330, chloroplastic-like n=1 Tax=Primulina eburnea TaxID=1245227 RepID=UPI003C6C0ECB